ncbi:Vhr1-domain-containing protein [Yamadazyma tenuis ATCC 10573]|uniref:Vhr1-domain-containing protein n=1 Tax=Candida tenuis (strain ATCC 10573 / BCRC 21748 / CBS 615 / JCM 9827 / NBRC 10315 / NRRL Y-1498 / VKM Y-70) TaxID=590646 RepID=G3BC02_CANTC|nr:Vhr1-domain-containing protein [Yamadazyma tenuis ATCC 10573]EGV60747.1 Vhr1-domain-containing protein [Yamadazyma tenuis ATCC 10573]
MTEEEQYRRLGVTHAIRDKLDFHDERRWKRFSARRLELIDTLDLSSKKASEQEANITKVAEALRIEFEYSSEYFDEFDRLVRAAIQSVRRNRKRSSKSKRSQDKLAGKIAKVKHESFDGGSSNTDSFNSAQDDNEFVSEYTKFNSDSQDDTNEYSKSKHISNYDQSRAAIVSMVQPRVGRQNSNFLGAKLPSFESLSAVSSLAQISSKKAVLLNYIERSKSCAEATVKKTANLEFLGRGIIIASVGYVFERSFASTNEKSLDYLRGKLVQESYLADFFRNLETLPNKDVSLNDEAAVTTLYALLGGCIKDFGFEAIMFPLCELLYWNIIREYPLIAQSSVPFRSTDSMGPTSQPSPEIQKSDSFLQLESLAAVASQVRKQEQVPPALRSLSVSPVAGKVQGKKAVALRFLSQTLNFTFPTKVSATPKLDELLENARSAFHLSSYGDSQVLGLKNMKDGFILKSDADVERVFTSEDHIELEIFTQKPQAVPIYEITSLNIPNGYILPPPVPGGGRINSRSPDTVPTLAGGSFKFLSNQDDHPPPHIPPVPILPKFQPLL